MAVSMSRLPKMRSVAPRKKSFSSSVLDSVILSKVERPRAGPGRPYPADICRPPGNIRFRPVPRIRNACRLVDVSPCRSIAPWIAGRPSFSLPHGYFRVFRALATISRLHRLPCRTKVNKPKLCQEDISVISTEYGHGPGRSAKCR